MIKAGESLQSRYSGLLSTITLNLPSMDHLTSLPNILEEKLAFMEIELQELRSRLGALEKEHLRVLKICDRLNKKLSDRQDIEPLGENPWETGSKL